MIQKLLVCVLTLGINFVANAEDFPIHPNPELTPGELCGKGDPDFSQYRYSEKIPYCIRNVNTEQKSRIYGMYHIEGKTRHNYTVDHYIPLSLGGNNSMTNLWPEHHKIKALRATLEYDLYEKLEYGEITQAEALKIIVDAKMHPPIDQIMMLDLFE